MYLFWCSHYCAWRRKFYQDKGKHPFMRKAEQNHTSEPYHQRLRRLNKHSPSVYHIFLSFRNSPAGLLDEYKHHNPCEIVSNFVKHSCKQVGLTCSHLSHHSWWWWYKFCSGTRKNTWQAYCTLIPRCYWFVWERVSKVAAMIHYFRKI